MQLGDARRGKFADNLTGFGRSLRRAGIPVDSARMALATEALLLVGLGQRDDAGAALEAVMVSREQDRAVFRELLTSPEHLSDLIGLFRSGHVLVVLTAIQDAVDDGVLPKGVGAGILPAIMGATVLPSVLAITLHQITPNVDFAKAILEGGHHDLAVLLGLL